MVTKEEIRSGQKKEICLLPQNPSRQLNLSRCIFQLYSLSNSRTEGDAVKEFLLQCFVGPLTWRRGERPVMEW